jgi:hypothetical protein
VLARYAEDEERCGELWALASELTATPTDASLL